MCRPVSGVRREPRCAASAWNTTACGTMKVRCPALAARQQKSMSLPKIGSAESKPLSCSITSRRTSIPAVFTASTSRTSSCWPWSYSPRSRPVSRRPVPEIVMPSSSRRRNEGHSRSLGPRIAASGRSCATRSSCSSASGAGRQSSCSSQIHSAFSWASPSASSPASTASGYDVEPGTTRGSAPVAERTRSTLPSRLVVSTHTTWLTGEVCSARPSSTEGSQRSPLWLTSRAATAVDTGKDSIGGPQPPPIRDQGCPRCGRVPARYRRPLVTSDRALLELAALPLGQAAPDAEALVVHQCVLQAVTPHVAGETDLLGFPRGATFFGEKRLGVGLSAQCALLPTRLFGVPVEEKQFSHDPRPFDPVVSRPPEVSGERHCWNY